MKNPEDIEEYVRQVLAEELQKRLDRPPLPHLCQHNFRQPLDHRREVLGERNPTYNRVTLPVVSDEEAQVVDQTIGLCMLGSENPDQWRGTVCEDPIDAQNCPYFTPSDDANTIYEQFVQDVQDEAWLESHLPRVAGLLWVLGRGVEVVEGVSGFWARIGRAFRERPDLPDTRAAVTVYLPKPL